VLIGTFSRYPGWATIATVGIVFAAVYMLWIFQRTMTGPVRGFGVLGARGDDFGLDDGPGGTRVPVTAGAPALSAGAHRSVLEPEGAGLTGNSVGESPPARAQAHAPSRVRAKFGDLTAREILVLTPLVVLIIGLGVYPKPVLDVINPTAERTMVDVGYTDPPPAIAAPIKGGQ